PSPKGRPRETDPLPPAGTCPWPAAPGKVLPFDTADDTSSRIVDRRWPSAAIGGYRREANHAGETQPRRDDRARARDGGIDRAGGAAPPGAPVRGGRTGARGRGAAAAPGADRRGPERRGCTRRRGRGGGGGGARIGGGGLGRPARR